MDIKGFKKVEYSDMQSILNDKYKQTGVEDIKLAVEIDVKSTQTIQNALNLERQIVSDEVLTRFADRLKMGLCVAYVRGEREYYIPTKII